MLSVHKHVQMVWHVAVRNECKPFVDGCASNLRTHDVDARRIRECLVPPISAKRQEIGVWAKVVEQFQALGSSRQHARGKASGAPAGPPKGGHYEPVVTFLSYGFSQIHYRGMAEAPRTRTRAPLVIKGARTHNLKNIDVSGSGKSSLAFDTIYAEGQRRYVESLSAYARQFLERMEKPDVDRIEGICPAIAIRQKNSIRNPRSTVGTTTEIHDYMRLLFARVGRTFCRQCGQEVVRETAEVVARRLGELAGARLLIGYEIPVVADAPRGFVAEEGESQDEDSASAARTFDPAAETLETLRRRGFGRLLLDGRAVAFEEVDSAALKSRTRLEVVVDRLRIEGDLRSRLTDSIETSYREGGGAAFAVNADTGERFDFSERFECRTCGIAYETPQPRLFSFNNPFGACPTCHGFGNVIELDMGLVVPDPSKSINEGAIEPWSKPHYRAQLAELKRAARKGAVRLDVPWTDLTD